MRAPRIAQVVKLTLLEAWLHIFTESLRVWPVLAVLDALVVVAELANVLEGLGLVQHGLLRSVDDGSRLSLAGLAADVEIWLVPAFLRGFVAC